MNCIWASLLGRRNSPAVRRAARSAIYKSSSYVGAAQFETISGVVALSHVGEDRRSPAGVDRVHVRAGGLISSMRSSTSWSVGLRSR